MLSLLLENFSFLKSMTDQRNDWRTVKPRNSAPAYNEIPPIEHINFGPEKYFLVFYLLVIVKTSV